MVKGYTYCFHYDNFPKLRDILPELARKVSSDITVSVPSILYMQLLACPNIRKDKEDN